MPHDVSKEQILDIIRRWKSGEITAEIVHGEAEHLITQWEWPQYPKNDHRSIVVEVLSHLEILSYQLITEEDIPTINAFLNTPKGEEMAGWQAWEAYWDHLDFNERRKTLANHPYYIT